MVEPSNKLATQLQVDDTLSHSRLDQVITNQLAPYSRNLIKQWIKYGYVTVNGVTVTKPSHLIGANDCINIEAPLAKQPSWQAQAMNPHILYQDESIFIINKPSGLVTHPAPNSPDSTLANALLYHDPYLQRVTRSGIIHRLDKDTSGLLVVARTETVYDKLIAAMKNRTIHRHYYALVNGRINASGRVAAPIARHPKNRTKMAVVSDGKEAITEYEIVERFPFHTLVKARLLTGRTHQIRVHMAHLGHPVVADHVYGRQRLPKKAAKPVKQALKALPRQALHAYYLGLTHPQHYRYQQWESPLPEEMAELMQLLRDYHD
jgi:23S rRNA pseudouridine1911/1915/1917 synthase